MEASTIQHQTFVNGFVAILTEAFEGPQQEWSYFIDHGRSSGLFGTLQALSPELASRAPAPGLNTIAAHAEHTRFHLAGLNEGLRGKFKKLDWAESWKKQQVDEGAWRQLQAELRQEYETLRRFAQESETWDETAISGAVAVVAHVAYHLGAMRQVMRVIEAQDAQ